MGNNTVIQEQLSLNIVKILTYPNEWLIKKSDVDVGIDFTIAPYTPISNMTFDVQVKSTHGQSIRKNNDTISYDFDSKNYNDLVGRYQENLKNSLGAPFFLLLCVLDNDVQKRVELSPFKIAVSGEVYWYLPQSTDAPTENSNSKTIKIPKSNLITSTNTLDTVLLSIWKNK